MKKLVCFLAVLGMAWFQAAFAQSGTYYKNFTEGASCTIAIEQQGTKIITDVFAWWHTPSGRHGVLSGEGILKGTQAVISSTDKDDEGGQDCRIYLTFKPGTVNVKFAACEAFNLMDDFNGTYKKVSDNTPGYYVVVTDKCYFYKSDNTASKLKTYLIKGNKVDVSIENITDKNWVYINFTNAKGHNTSGYVRWQELKRI